MAKSSAAVLIGLLALAVGVTGYVIGHRGPDYVSVTELNANAYIGEDQATFTSDGWSYAVPLDVRWQDASSTWHDGRPACLQRLGETAHVRVGYVPVTVNGVSWRAVVWVSC
jgi:hypothetical protein